MKASICTHSGIPEVLQFKEVEKPMPKYREVLVNVHATTLPQVVNDLKVRTKMLD